MEAETCHVDGANEAPSRRPCQRAECIFNGGRELRNAGCRLERTASRASTNRGRRRESCLRVWQIARGAWTAVTVRSAHVGKSGECEAAGKNSRLGPLQLLDGLSFASFCGRRGSRAEASEAVTTGTAKGLESSKLGRTGPGEPLPCKQSNQRWARSGWQFAAGVSRRFVKVSFLSLACMMSVWAPWAAGAVRRGRRDQPCGSSCSWRPLPVPNSGK